MTSMLGIRRPGGLGAAVLFLAAAAVFAAGSASWASWWQPGVPPPGRTEPFGWPGDPMGAGIGAYPIARDAREAQRRHLEAADRYLSVRDYEEALRHYALARGPLMAFWSYGRLWPDTRHPRAPLAPSAPPAPPAPGMWPDDLDDRDLAPPALRHEWEGPGAVVYSRAISSSLAREADRGISRIAEILHGPRRRLAEAIDAIEKGKAGEAFSLLQRVAEADEPEPAPSGYAAMAQTLLGQIEREALATVRQAEEALARGDDSSLLAALQEARRTYGGFGDIPRALDAYRRLEREPDFRARLREIEARADLSEAERLLEGSRARSGLAALEKAAQRHQGTMAGQRAADRLAELEADPDFAQVLGGEEARSLFSRAVSFERNNLLDRAKELYQRVVEEHPHTEQAAEAREALGRLEGGNDED